jgi:hypothetical protein
LTGSSIEFVFAVLIVFMLTEIRKHIAWCENVGIKNDIAWCNFDVYDCIGEVTSKQIKEKMDLYPPDTQ